MRSARIRRTLALVIFAATVPLGRSQSNTVTVVGSISSKITHQEQPDEPLRFVLTVKNTTGVELNSVRLVRGPKDYEITNLCMVSVQQIESCKGLKEFSATGNTLTSSIHTGQSVTFWGELAPTSAHEGERLSLVVGWTTGKAADLSYSSALLDLGENQVQSRKQRIWAWIYEFTKIFGIPLALAGFAFFLNSLATRSSVKAEIWKQMLPVSHQYAAKFYLPISSAATELTQALEQRAYQRAFFYLLLFLRRMSDTIKTVGGFYFKDLRGEDLASKCLSHFRNEFLGDKNCEFRLSASSCAQLIKGDDTFAGFLNKFNLKTTDFGFKMKPYDLTYAEFAELTRCWDLFENKIKDLESEKNKKKMVLRYLKAYYAILDFEVNRPYKYWYPGNASLKLSPNTKSLLKKMGEEAGISKYQMMRYMWGSTKTG